VILKRSPRLRFSLRTLFVVLTVFCIWLGYSLNWIKQRRELISYPYPANDTAGPGAIQPSAPGLLWILGERGVAVLLINAEDKESESRARRLFPEALIVTSKGSP
jgi:hypothetical protein